MAVFMKDQTPGTGTMTIIIVATPGALGKCGIEVEQTSGRGGPRRAVGEGPIQEGQRRMGGEELTQQCITMKDGKSQIPGKTSGKSEVIRMGVGEIRGMDTNVGSNLKPQG